MSINHLYSIWRSRMLQRRPQECIARVRNQGWLITAIFYGRAVQWGPIADADQGEKPDSYLGVYYHQSLAVILER